MEVWRAPQRAAMICVMPDLNETFMRVADHVHPGEWTTYGDISAAVRGDKRAARAVGRAAATEDEFPNAHRVLRSPGRISPGVGACSGGRGVEGVRERLFAEGVVFDETGRADPTKHVHWDELRRRAGRARPDRRA